jgi:hypothetical protein
MTIFEGEMSIQTAHRRETLAACVRRYFDACNEADREKMYTCFSDPVVHYFPPGVGGPYVGKQAIADLWINTVRVNGSCWTIDRMIADDSGVAIEWTHFKPKIEEWIRGAEWYEFDDDGRIRSIRAYYASPRDTARKINELEGFPYREQGFPVVPPRRASETL